MDSWILILVIESSSITLLVSFSAQIVLTLAHGSRFRLSPMVSDSQF